MAEALDAVRLSAPGGEASSARRWPLPIGLRPFTEIERGSHRWLDGHVGQYLEPGYSHPFVSQLVDTDAEVASVEARIEDAKFVEEREGLNRHNDSMSVTDAQLGSDDKAISSTWFTGTLVNDGEAKDYAQVTLVLFDEQLVPVYGRRFEVRDIPANGSVDFEERLGIGLELPEYDSVTVDILTK